MQIRPRLIKNILVVRNDRFGEFLLNIPALRALKETFINAKIIAVVNPYVRELAECVPFIDEVIEWKQERHTLSQKIGLIKLLKAKQADIAIMLNPSQEFNALTFLSGIPVRAGYDRKWGFLLTHKLEDKKYLGEKHEVEYNLELTRLLGADTQDKTLIISINNNSAGELAADSVALHPWTSDAIKQWPKDNFRKLAERIIRELNLKIIVIGGREEAAQAQELFADFAERLINLAGQTTLRQLAALLKKCRLLISGDSGPVHLACAVGTPVITLFRNDIPGKNARRWGPWGKGNIVIEKSGLFEISVDEVFMKTKQALAIEG